ncbi:MAG: hypothetical protein J5U19_02865 [Candidatus Methanoperedens sp.]|nr:hypothetical protein [Candidatus Methanoperedens sp.]
MLYDKFEKDERAIELPINIVVMLVVGMAALAALLSILPTAKQNLNVDIIEISVDNNVSKGSTAKVVGAGEHNISVKVKVFDKNNNPVQKSSVTFNGGGGLGASQTDDLGEAVIKLGLNSEGTSVTIRPNQQTAELKMVVKANGFYDYEDERAVLLYQTRK